MPLDMGALWDGIRDGEPREAAGLGAAARGAPRRDLPRTPLPPKPVHVGAALRAARERRGLTLEAVSASTRIGCDYLLALEEMRLDALPSRPFALGFVHAYAQALGLNAVAAVDRYRQEAPEAPQPLPTPLGVPQPRDHRLIVGASVGAVVLLATVVWNVARHGMVEKAPPPAVADAAVNASSPGQVLPPATPLVLGEPLPAPAEATTPTAYVTPGLAEAAANGGSADAGDAVRKAAAAQGSDTPATPLKLGVPFKGEGAHFGAPASGAAVLLKARRPVALIVRGADRVWFARQLGKGESFGMSAPAGLTVDVSDAGALEVYSLGVLQGLLPERVVAANKLAKAAPPAPKPAAATAPNFDPGPGSPAAASLRPSAPAPSRLSPGA